MQAGREAAATHHHSNHDAACMVCRFLEIPSSMMELTCGGPRGPPPPAAPPALCARLCPAAVAMPLC
jgi:hypothetical protein